MPSEDTKLLEFKLRLSFMQSSIRKIFGRKNNPEKSFMKNVSEHIPSCF